MWLYTARGNGTAKVENDDHRHHEQIAQAGAKLIPVRRDEEDDAASEKDSAEDECCSSLPRDTSNLGLSLRARGKRFVGARFFRRSQSRNRGSCRRLCGFPGADAIRCFRVENTGRLPAV